MPHAGFADADRIAAAKRSQPGDRDKLLKVVEKASFNPNCKAASEWNPPYDVVGKTYPVTGKPIGAADTLSSLQVHFLDHTDGFTASSPADYLDVLHGAAAVLRANPGLGRVRVGREKGHLKIGLTVPLNSLNPQQYTVTAQTGLDLFVVYNTTRGYIESGYTVESPRAPTMFRAWRPLVQVSS